VLGWIRPRVEGIRFRHYTNTDLLRNQRNRLLCVTASCVHFGLMPRLIKQAHHQSCPADFPSAVFARIG